MKALLVVDVTYAFMETEDYKGGLPVNGGERTALDIVDYITTNAEEYDLIILTKDEHNPEVATHDGFTAHGMVGTQDAEVHEEVLKITQLSGIDYAVIAKGLHNGAFSAFDNITLIKLLRQSNIDEITCVGIALDYCVSATAIDANALGFDTTVLYDLTASVAEDTAAEAMEKMQQLGIHLETSWAN